MPKMSDTMVEGVLSAWMVEEGQSVAAGDVIYSPAGTVHAIGPGITMIEVQQNVDLTYRLYDYGRPRELHLDAGIAVSEPVPFAAPPVLRAPEPGVAWRIEGAKFIVEQLALDGRRQVAVPQGRSAWVVPVTGRGTIDGAAFTAGECWIADRAVALDGSGDVIVAIPH